MYTELRIVLPGAMLTHPKPLIKHTSENIIDYLVSGYS